MRDDTPPPSMEHTEELQNNLPLDEDDIEVIDDLEIIELGDFNGEGAAPVEDNSKLTFRGHTGAVFCCNIDNNHGLAASGGEDDRGFVWDMTTGQSIFECTGHADSVISAAFNYDSSLVVTADMSGVVQVWDVQNKNKIWSYTTSDLKWLQWLPGKNFLMAGTDDGDGWLFEVTGNEELKVLPSFGVPSSHGRVMDEERVVIGYEDGTIRIWNYETTAVLKDIVGDRAHNGSVITIDYKNGLILSGSIDGTAKLVLASDGRVLNTFQCGEAAPGADSPDSVESVAFLTSQQSFVSGTLHGSVAVWDIGSHVQRLQFTQETAVVKVICHRTAPLLFTAGLDGIVRLYDVRTGHVESTWTGHVSEILDFDLTNDGRAILTASEDCTCKVFQVEQS